MYIVCYVFIYMYRKRHNGETGTKREQQYIQLYRHIYVCVYMLMYDYI